MRMRNKCVLTPTYRGVGLAMLIAKSHVLMASTARDEDDTKEYFDSSEELEKKVSQLVEWVRESKHMIVFTVSFIMVS